MKLSLNFRMQALLLGLLLLGATDNSAQAQWRMPKGKSVMIDGRLGQGEWDDAALNELPGLARVRAKRTEQYVFLAIELLNSEDGAVDLFVSPLPGDIYDLHASAKLGERKLKNGVWPDWNWWNNTGWVANTSRVDSFQKPSFLPTNVREFQISLSRFPGREWRIRFEIMTPAEPEWKTATYPVDAKATDTTGWIRLRIN